eukprot:682887-Hanusia_phi.AAC.1
MEREREREMEIEANIQDLTLEAPSVDFLEHHRQLTRSTRSYASNFLLPSYQALSPRMKKGRMTLQLLETRSYKCLLLVCKSEKLNSFPPSPTDVGIPPALMLLSCASLAVSQYDDDASASYDYDGTLILN